MVVWGKVMNQSRREFLKLAGVGAASLAANSILSSPGQSMNQVRAGQLARSWVTSSAKKCAASTEYSWKPVQAKEPFLKGESTCIIFADKKKQDILGFGAAFTDAACYNFKELPEGKRAELFHKLFSPSEMGFSVGRICMGSSDYAVHAYSYDDGEADPELKRFSIAHDTEYILPMLREARKVNPEMFLLASPWSPPGWMKPNNSMLGGNMQRKSLEVYANYFLKFLKAYSAQGVPIQAVSVQNEVDTDQDGRMPACAWPQEYEIDFVRNNLGPLLEKEGIKTKIWIIDHNYNLWGRAICELEAENMQNYVGGIAWHGYVGSPEQMSRVKKAFPKIDMYWTEGGPDYTDPAYAKDWVKWSSAFNGILNNWCKAIIGWNLSLDEVGKPNIGPFPCGGLVTINSKTKEITQSGQYHALAHYSKFISRGAHVLETMLTGSTEANKDLSVLAAENPDGRKILIATNGGASRPLKIKLGNQSLDVDLEANSLSTFVWA